MNNARIIMEDVNEEISATPILRQKAERLTEIVEALQHIATSSYWKVLRQNVFDVDLDKAKRRLALEKDTTEIFRLQGEIRWGDKFSLEKLLQTKQDELTAIRKKL